MKSRSLHSMARYGVAVVAVAAAFALNFLIPELDQTPPVLFLAAVTVSAWFGGLGPSLFATVVSVVLLDFFFIPEIYVLDLGPAVYVSTAVFVLVALFITSVNAVRARLELVLRQQNQRKSEFMAVLAHELRNFLAPIAPAVAALQLRGAGDATTTQACATVQRQLRNMTRLIEDLLDIARINEGKVRLSLEPVDLGSVVAQAVEGVRPLMQERGHHLELTVPSGPLPLAADATRLEQVFVNLLTNAAKYTDPGGRIALLVERTDGALLVRVRDNGRGLAPEVVPHIFDLFMQAESGSRGGLGVGLNLVRGLVELHGGSVVAHSAGLGRGSEFVVRLPAGAAGRAGEAAPVPVGHSAHPAAGEQH